MADDVHAAALGERDRPSAGPTFAADAWTAADRRPPIPATYVHRPHAARSLSAGISCCSSARSPPRDHRHTQKSPAGTHRMGPAISLSPRLPTADGARPEPTRGNCSRAGALAHARAALMLLALGALTVRSHSPRLTLAVPAGLGVASAASHAVILQRRVFGEKRTDVFRSASHRDHVALLSSLSRLASCSVRFWEAHIARLPHRTANARPIDGRLRFVPPTFRPLPILIAFRSRAEPMHEPRRDAAASSY